MPFRHNNKKRFAIYPKTENGWFSEKKIKGKFLKGMICLCTGRWQQTYQRVYSTDDSTEGKWKCFLFLIML